MATKRSTRVIAVTLSMCLAATLGGSQAAFADPPAPAWEQRSPTSTPTGTLGAAAAFDGIGGGAIMFGGQAGPAGNPNAETWRWDGTNWTHLSPAASPPARSLAAIGTEPSGTVLLVGGNSDGGLTPNLTDTWRWDGSTWTQLSPVTTPPAGGSMALDPATNQLMLVGPGGDTWRWSGADWTHLIPPTALPAGSQISTAPTASQVVAVVNTAPALVCSCGDSAIVDTYVWTGTTWSLRTPATSPPARNSFLLSPDTTGQTLLFGGTRRVNIDGGHGTYFVFDDTWRWDGTTWAQVSTTSQPSAGSYKAAATVAGRVLAFGGYDTFNGEGTDTWEWTPPAPLAPGSVSAAAGSDSATVSWTPPAPNGSGPVTGYVITPYVGSSAKPTQLAPAGATSEPVSGLARGYTYTFTVTAVTASRTGAPSAHSNPVIPYGPPGTPINVTATAGIDSATVHWTAPGNTGGAPITGYVVTPYVGSHAQTDHPFTTTATTQTIPGLARGYTYTFRVAAVNGHGTGNRSAASNAVTPHGPPATPSNAHARPGNAAATVSWTAPSFNGGSAITGYVVTPYVSGVAQSPHPFNSTATTETIAGLSNGTSYQFRVAAVNVYGTGNASAASPAIKVGTPSAPAFVSVSAGPGAGQASMHWWSPDGNGSPVSGYVVIPYIKGVAQPVHNFTQTANSLVVSGLAHGTTYTFTIAARNAVGVGPASSPVGPITTS
ncbi:MAG: fibronectin type protein [Acidimicrobiales bacterium]|nr:fibronectin type protein [Acidimicrobiales bacterium]